MFHKKVIFGKFLRGESEQIERGASIVWFSISIRVRVRIRVSVKKMIKAGSHINK